MFFVFLHFSQKAYYEKTIGNYTVNFWDYQTKNCSKKKQKIQNKKFLIDQKFQTNLNFHFIFLI